MTELLAGVHQHGRDCGPAKSSWWGASGPPSGTRRAATTSTAPRACGTATSVTGAPRSSRRSRRQMQRLAAYHTFNEFANRPALALADKVASIAPMADAAVYFTPGRRLRRDRHRRQAGPPLLVGGRKTRQAGDRRAPPRLPRHERLRHEPGRDPGQHRGLRRAGRARRARRLGHARRPRGVVRAHAGKIAAFIGEPVIGAGGDHPAAGRLLAGRRSPVPQARRAA